MDCSMPGFPVLHYLLEIAQTHVPWVGDAIQLSHPLSSPSPPVLNLSSGSFPVSCLCIRWPKYWSFSFSLPINIQGWFPLGWMGWSSSLSKGRSGVFSSTTIQKHQFFRRNTYWIANKAIPIVKKSIRKHSRKLKPSHSIVSRVFWEFKIV